MAFHPGPGVVKAGNAMAFFKLFSPVSYWLLIVLWSWIFVFYLRRIRHKKLESRFFTTLLVILAIVLLLFGPNALLGVRRSRQE